MCNVGMAANDTLTPTPDVAALTGPDGSFSLTAPVEGTCTRSNATPTASLRHARPLPLKMPVALS